LRPILLINPNRSKATTDMMVALAQGIVGTRAQIHGVTATSGPLMITTERALDAAEAGVVEIGLREAGGGSGVIVAAFGDPGVAALRRRLATPVIGICEAAMFEAAASGRRFAVVTTTPDLVARIGECATRFGLGGHYAGTWVTQGDAVDLVGDPLRLETALADAVATCLREATVEAVIIGGGPLTGAVAALSDQFAIPIVAHVAAAIRRLIDSVDPAPRIA
jgi:Asp/Glu/hydantoin racemase